jgi:hypothetical protein
MEWIMLETMVLVYIKGHEQIYDVCESLNKAQILYGVHWAYTELGLLNGKTIYKLVIGG